VKEEKRPLRVVHNAAAGRAAEEEEDIQDVEKRKLAGRRLTRSVGGRVGV
jgi:hypothetical protein